MAGTQAYKLRVAHVFQRRFDSESLGKALNQCHWYIISRRPSVRIIPNSVMLDDGILTLDFIMRESIATPPDVHHMGAEIVGTDMAHSFKVHTDGAYFSLRIGDSLIHGDAWALASVLSQARADIARQEVLYIGKAFGGGERNAWERTSNHKKLQRIYEDHVGQDWDIFVAPMFLEARHWTTDDHIDDLEDGPSVEAYYSNFANMNGGILESAVDLIEHSLISYFAPHYQGETVLADSQDIPM